MQDGGKTFRIEFLVLISSKYSLFERRSWLKFSTYSWLRYRFKVKAFLLDFN